MTVSVFGVELLLWVILPTCNFLLWYQMGSQQTKPIEWICPQSIVTVERSEHTRGQQLIQEPQFSFTSVESSRFQRHRGESELGVTSKLLSSLSRGSNRQIKLSSQHHHRELLSFLLL
jgi:hypothetical protein